MTATARVLFASTLVKVSDVACATPKSGGGCERCDPISSITIMRRGVHAYHARGRVALAEAGLALLYRGGEPYCLSHPYDRDLPDRSTCIEFDGALLEETFGTARHARDLGTHLSPGTQVLNLQAMAALGADESDRLTSEETTLGLVQAIASDFDLSREDRHVPMTARRRVQRARAFIAAQPEADHSLAAVAAAAACSPFHLARLFKRHTGMTIRGYRRRLRLVMALDHLADGATDLTGLAMRAGFSDHSHMTTSFRRVFGSTPSALRESLRSRGLKKQSKFLQAAASQRL
jgi:AraC family transcriptional regulator